MGSENEKTWTHTILVKKKRKEKTHTVQYVFNSVRLTQLNNMFFHVVNLLQNRINIFWVILYFYFHYSNNHYRVHNNSVELIRTIINHCTRLRIITDYIIEVMKSQGFYEVLMGLWSFIRVGPRVFTIQVCASFYSWRILPLASVLYFSITVSQVSFVLFQWRESAWGRPDCPLSYKEWNSWLQWINSIYWREVIFCLIEHEGHKCKCLQHTLNSHIPKTETLWVFGVQEVDKIKKMQHKKRDFQLWSR